MRQTKARIYTRLNLAHLKILSGFTVVMATFVATPGDVALEGVLLPCKVTNLHELWC